MKVDEEPNGNAFLTYKGYPLARKDDEIYFGNINDDYYIYIKIIHKNSSAVEGLPIADKVMVYKVSTDDTLNLMDAIIRNSEKTSLYEALDLAVAWLKRKELV